jgi:hypothetical protein
MNKCAEEITGAVAVRLKNGDDAVNIPDPDVESRAGCRAGSGGRRMTAPKWSADLLVTDRDIEPAAQ